MITRSIKPCRGLAARWRSHCAAAVLVALVLSVSSAQADDLLDQAVIIPTSDAAVAGHAGDFPSILPTGYSQRDQLPMAEPWWTRVRTGYDEGFVIASDPGVELDARQMPFRMQINGWGQLRHTLTNTSLDGQENDTNQFQLKRARLVFSGSAFNPDFSYFFQIDGRSSSGDDLRLLDYVLTYDAGHDVWDFDRGELRLKVGKYKMPLTMSRWLSGREFEFTDRSMASMFFDVNRSLGWGLEGRNERFEFPLHWEVALFNGLVTGGAETGSSGTLDNNFAYSARVFAYPTGEWGKGSLADFDGHSQLATRVGVGFASSTIERTGATEFSRVRVVDSGERLSDVISAAVDQYTVNIAALDWSAKYRGWSATAEYYFRVINAFHGADQPALYDHGFWLQAGYFVIPRKFQVLSRWSRVVGDSGTLGAFDQSSDEFSGGCAWYFRDQHAKFVVDLTYLNGASINSAALDISPREEGVLFRSQFQFAF